MGDAEAAEELMTEAYESWKRINPRDTRRLDELDESEFDRLVGFWSR